MMFKEHKDDVILTQSLKPKKVSQQQIQSKTKRMVFK